MPVIFMLQTYATTRRRYLAPASWQLDDNRIAVAQQKPQASTTSRKFQMMRVRLHAPVLAQELFAAFGNDDAQSLSRWPARDIAAVDGVFPDGQPRA